MPIMRLNNMCRSLFEVAAPEAWLVDLLSLEMVGRHGNLNLDPLFVEACDPTSLVVVAVSAEYPVLGAVGARVEGSRVRVHAQCPASDPVAIHLLVAGRRRDISQRLPRRTPEQKAANERFWASSKELSAGVNPAQTSED